MNRKNPRYGFVGRNGLGKSTVLRMISSGQLRIPSHVTVLHVEQEVIGDETQAIQSVLEADIVREGLLQEEKELTSRVESGAASPEESSRLTEVFQSLEAEIQDNVTDKKCHPVKYEATKFE